MTNSSIINDLTANDDTLVAVLACFSNASDDNIA